MEVDIWCEVQVSRSLKPRLENLVNMKRDLTLIRLMKP